MNANMEVERDRELAAQAQEEIEVEVLWHKGYQGFNRTTFEAPDVPTAAEAANIVSVIEDEAAAEIRVDAVKEVEDDE